MDEKNSKFLYGWIIICAITIFIMYLNISRLKKSIYNLENENKEMQEALIVHSATILDILKAQSLMMHVLGGHRIPLDTCPRCKKIPYEIPHEMPRPSNPDDKMSIVL